MDTVERLPAPWAMIPHSESFEIRDASGRTLVFVYFEDEPARRMTLRRIPSEAARSLASRIARIPDEPISGEERQSPTPPWISEERGECFVVVDENGDSLAHIYFEDEPLRRRSAGRVSRETARRLASRISKIGNFGLGGKDGT